MKKRMQAGFTLVEIAIVLVIIGLLLGGILKGQELIENARIKRLVNDFNGTSAAYNAYRDRYRQLPGDDSLATARGWTGAVNGGGDGIVGAANANPFTAAGENLNFWRDLRFSGLLNGNPALNAVATALPNNDWGGRIGVTTSTTLLTGGGSALTGLLVCSSNVPGKAAQGIDTSLDDGVPTTGAIRASVGVGNAVAPAAAAQNATAYNETSTYVMCKQM